MQQKEKYRKEEKMRREARRCLEEDKGVGAVVVNTEARRPTRASTSKVTFYRPPPPLASQLRRSFLFL